MLKKYIYIYCILAVYNLSHIHTLHTVGENICECQQYICGIQDTGLSSPCSWWFLEVIWGCIIETTLFSPQQGCLFSELSKVQCFFSFYSFLVLFTDELGEDYIFCKLGSVKVIYFDALVDFQNMSVTHLTLPY